jgi:hypothetical protein
MKMIFAMAVVQLQPVKLPVKIQPINSISQISPNSFQLSNSNYNMINRIQNGGKCLACNKQ